MITHPWHDCLPTAGPPDWNVGGRRDQVPQSTAPLQQGLDAWTRDLLVETPCTWYNRWHVTQCEVTKAGVPHRGWAHLAHRQAHARVHIVGKADAQHLLRAGVPAAVPSHRCRQAPPALVFGRPPLHPRLRSGPALSRMAHPLLDKVHTSCRCCCNPVLLRISQNLLDMGAH